MTSSIFSKEIFDYVADRYENMCADLADHLKNKFVDDDEFFEIVEEFALQKLTKEAYVELAHHNEKLRKSCGFGDCHYYPNCLRGLE